MGQKPLSENEPSARYSVSLTSEVAAKAEESAKALGVSVSELIRMALLKAFRAAGWTPAGYQPAPKPVDLGNGGPATEEERAAIEGTGKRTVVRSRPATEEERKRIEPV